ncbi:MAG TPA: LLM class flavin-dependent oxidoreductase [Stellaceae bacterium]|nr:LLM class flavin-dependent oxidoreductase [Stellaceae bacterium]
MEFGVFDHLDRSKLPLKDYYESRLKLIEAYDRAGFRSYHVAEHHFTPLGMAPSPSVFLAAVAQRTERLRFGPLVYALPLYHPVRLIEEICMLDHMSGGRLDIGFGRGASPIEIEYFGVDPAQAPAMYDEALALITQALTSKVLNFEGEFFRFDNVPMELEPLQKPHPPIWYGIHSVESSARAARRGLHMVSPDSIADSRAYARRYRTVWHETNGNAPTPKIGLTRFIVVADTDEEALAIARRIYPVWHHGFTYLFRMHDRAQRHAQPDDYDTVIRVGRGIAGSPDTVADFLATHLRESESDYLAGQFAFGDITLEESMRSLDLFTRHVMPMLRETVPTPAVTT